MATNTKTSGDVSNSLQFFFVQVQLSWPVVHRSRLAFTAISGTDTSMLQILLPHALQWPAVLHGLLALAVRPSGRGGREFRHYDAAVSELRLEMDRLQTEGPDMARIERVLSSSFLLGVFAFSHCDGCWSHHIRGMISVIRMAGWQTLISSDLGSFLLGVCAHQDISAFSVGRQEQSQKAWLSWLMCPRGNRNDKPFTALETIMGYPESLISIIALISEATDDNVIAYWNKSSLTASSAAIVTC